MPVSFSFNGCGSYFPFMLGVAHGLKSNFDLDWSKVYIHGVSGGLSGALALVMMNEYDIDNYMNKLTSKLESMKINNFKDFYNGCLSVIPEDAYKYVTDKFYIGVTEIPRFKPALINGPFSTNKELMKKIQSSSSLPFLTGNIGYKIDGGFSHYAAVYDENTIVITLRQQEHSDIFLSEVEKFEEFKLINTDKMKILYEEGKKSVSNNLEKIKNKIEKGIRNNEIKEYVPLNVNGWFYSFLIVILTILILLYFLSKLNVIYMFFALLILFLFAFNNYL